MMHLPILPLIIPLVAGFLILFAKNKGIFSQRLLSFVSIIAIFIVTMTTFFQVLQVDYITYQLGNWEAPFGISLVADRFSVLLVLVTTLLAFGALMYAVANDIDTHGDHFHSLFALQLFGINGAFLTGDLFNLFVFFEVLLLASYALLLHGGGKERTKAGLHYVVINLVGSTLFLFAVGTLYGILGTLNIADLAYQISLLDANNTTIVAVAGLLLLFVFGLKAALFPLFLWLPGAYAKTSAPVAALFAIMTKVGIYSIIRVHGTLFGDAAGELAHYHTPWIINLGFITLVMATFGAMYAKDLKTIVAYLVLASVSVLLIAIGINNVQALSGAVYYMVHSTFLAASFFLIADNIAKIRMDASDKLIQAPNFEKSIFVGSFFFLIAIAVAGLPPLSGFFGKIMILSAALGHMQQGLIFTLILSSSLLIVVSLAKAGSQIFYDTDANAQKLPNATNGLSYVAIVYLFLFAPLMVVFANAIDTFTLQTATTLFDPKSYITAVLGYR